MANNNMTQAAEKLGVNTRTTVYKLIADGKLRSQQIGSRRVVSDQAILDCIELLEKESVLPSQMPNPVRGKKKSRDAARP